MSSPNYMTISNKNEAIHLVSIDSPLCLGDREWVEKCMGIPSRFRERRPGLTLLSWNF